MRPLLIRLHRWLGLAAMAFWLVQAATGIFCVFHWEIDDATIAAPHRATDLAAIDRRLALLAPPGSGRAIGSIWTSAGAADRWDVTVDDARAGTGEQVRIDGAGDVLRIRRDGERFADGGWIDTLVILHQTLLAGDAGRWIIGLSGVLLLTNILFGLWIGWPRGGRWRQALAPPRAGGLAARLHGWHRAIGLWAAIPALLLVSAGTLRAFDGAVERMIATPLTAPAVTPQGTPILLSRAAAAALARHPDARLAGIGFPASNDAVWKIRLRAPGEPVRAYGNTTVFVDGNDGRILADYPAAGAPIGTRVANLIYPLHTGEIGGRAGRIAVLLLGLWLLGMIAIGASLWWTRRRPRKGRHA